MEPQLGHLWCFYNFDVDIMLWPVTTIVHILLKQLQVVFIIAQLKFKQQVLYGSLDSIRGHHDRDHMVVGFTTTYTISAYHHWCCEFKSHSGRGVQHYVIKFVSDLWQVGGFLRVLWFPPPIKLIATI
jgi:hypothetical protein